MNFVNNWDVQSYTYTFKFFVDLPNVPDVANELKTIAMISKNVSSLCTFLPCTLEIHQSHCMCITHVPQYYTELIIFYFCLIPQLTSETELDSIAARLVQSVESAEGNVEDQTEENTNTISDTLENILDFVGDSSVQISREV